MKIIATLLSSLLCLTAANAQRVADLQITLTSPASGATVTSGQQQQLASFVENHGPDSLRATDTVVVRHLMDGFPVYFMVNGQMADSLVLTGKVLHQHDTMQYNLDMYFVFPASENGPHAICLSAMPLNGTDPVTDDSLNNNLSCANVTFAGGTTGVPGVTGYLARNQVTNIYPMPAQAELTVELELVRSSQVAVRVFDLAGREVLREVRGQMSRGRQAIRMNTASLAGGVYLYQVSMDDEQRTGKLLIAK